jgi:hypothetical protein
VTQLITEVILRRAKFVVLALAVLAVVQTVLLMSMAFGVLPRLQERQDDLAVSQDSLRAAVTASADSAAQAKTSAESTDRLLRDTVAALAVPSPTALHTRAQLDAICRAIAGDNCPNIDDFATTTTPEGE